MKRFLISISLILISFFATSQGGGKGMFRALLDNTGTPIIPGTNTPFTFTEIPYSDPDFINPGRGAEQWHNGSQSINNPIPDTLIEPFDVYYRGQWAEDLEGPTQGSYAWITNPSDNWFDNHMREAINSGKQFSFGIMTVFTGQGHVSYNGATSSYPQYVHNLMQAEAVNSRDWISNGAWVPNYNSPNYLGRLRALHEALNTHILNTSYTAVSGPRAGQSVRYRDAIYAIDIRGYGQWGEWHSYDICNWDAFPTGRQPTIASLKELIDLHTEVFQNWPLSMLVAAYDGGKTGIPIFVPIPEIGWYALNASNSWGPSGFRRDQWGANDPYLNTLLVGNDMTYNGSVPFNTIILAKYQTSPVTGEVYPGAAGATGMVLLEGQVQTYGATSFGNGNWGGFPSDPTTQNRIRAAWKRSGYRIKIIGGNAPTIINRGVAFSIVSNWQNVGICPAYNEWTVQYELQTQVGSTVLWTGTSSRTIKHFLPSGTATTTTDILTVPGSVSAGTYKLVVRVKDPLGYRPDMKLAIQNRNADGSYTIFGSVTVN